MNGSDAARAIIRRAAVADADRIGAVHTASWQWIYRGRFPDDFLDAIDPARPAAAWKRNLGAEPPADVFVAEVEGEIVGFCHVGPSGDGDDDHDGPIDHDARVGELHAIYLVHDAAGNGVGRALMDAGIDALRSAGFTEVILWVLESNREARGFYEHTGWRLDGTRRTFTIRNIVEAPAVRYRLDLGD